jgi:NADH:ubiquinone oxidoreductase subunit
MVVGMNLVNFLKSFGRGDFIGEDSLGNKYFENSHFRRYGRPVRQVKYNGWRESSKVPPEWHAWLHHTRKDAPIDCGPKYTWEKPHLPNLTGSAFAHKPLGWLRGKASIPKSYEPWTPSDS